MTLLMASPTVSASLASILVLFGGGAHSNGCWSSSWYADAVTAKPCGIRIPNGVKELYISPSDAFFPPTRGTSELDSSEKLRMYTLDAAEIDAASKCENELCEVSRRRDAEKSDMDRDREIEGWAGRNKRRNGRSR